MEDKEQEKKKYTVSRYPSGKPRRRRPAPPVFVPRAYDVDKPRQRKPLDPKTQMDFPPAGGTDYSDGKWRDRQGRVVAHAKSENSQYTPHRPTRTSGNNQMPTFRNPSPVDRLKAAAKKRVRGRQEDDNKPTVPYSRRLVVEPNKVGPGNMGRGTTRTTYQNLSGGRPGSNVTTTHQTRNSDGSRTTRTSRATASGTNGRGTTSRPTVHYGTVKAPTSNQKTIQNRALKRKLKGG